LCNAKDLSTGTEETKEKDRAREVKPATQKEGKNEQGTESEPRTTKKTKETQTKKPRRGADERIIDNTLRIPVAEMSGLTPLIVQNLTTHFHIDTFFPVQSTVIPAIMQSIACGGRLLNLCFNTLTKTHDSAILEDGV
jgi:superfamily II DNA/RNA helicase